MIEPYLRKFDWLVLKPIWLALLSASLILLVQTQWLAGIAMLALALFGVAGVGAALHRERTAAELAAGYPSRSSIAETIPSTIDDDTSRRIASVVFRLAIVLALAAAILAVHIGLRWYVVLLTAIVIVWLGPILLMLPLATLVRRQ